MARSRRFSIRASGYQSARAHARAALGILRRAAASVAAQRAHPYDGAAFKPALPVV